MARSYNVEVLVLKRTNLNEADRLITFLPKFKGKFTAIAKGVRKIASRRGPNLELFNHVKAHFASGKNFDVVTEVITIHTFKNIKNNLEKTGYSYYLIEVCNSFLADGQGGREIFELLTKALHLIEESKKPADRKKILRAFELKILDKVGFRPQLRDCVKCNKVVSGQKFLISPELGGVLHNDCTSNSLFTKPLSLNGLKALRFFQDEDWTKIRRLVLPSAVDSELEAVSYLYMEYLLEKEIKSNEFINHLRHFSSG